MADPPRPNILYLHSHDTSRYVQPYGHGVSTPHIQRLAEQGVPVKDELSAKLEHWMKETDDPLLDGPIPAPPGAEYNDPDQLSPGEPTRMTKPAAT
jgi:hypothetical protein